MAAPAKNRMIVMKYIIMSIMVVMISFLSSLGLAETKEIIAEGTYNMGAGEMFSVAESKALLQAKRAIVEQAMPYVEEYLKVRNIKLTEDEKQIMSFGLINITLLEKKKTIGSDGTLFWVKVMSSVNAVNVEDIAISLKEKSVIDEYRKIIETYKKSQKAIDELKKQLTQIKEMMERKPLQAKIKIEEILFKANELFEKGYYYRLNNDYDSAVKAYTSLISLAPNFADAYNSRGNVYIDKGQYDTAIENYNKAIVINPNFEEAYNNIGFAYSNKALYDKEMEGYNKAIAINPNFDKAYYNRGTSYHYKGLADKAIEDYNKVISINPNFADVYNSRGSAYAMTGIKDRAILDFQKACDMGNENGCKGLQFLKK